jgi:hypothetical protein
MAYSEDHAVNDIVLAVINDGNGSMCGLTYQHRCDIVRRQAGPVAMMQFRNACRRYSQYSRLRFETPCVPHEKVNAAAQLVLEYYRQHVKEIEASK